MSHQLKPLLNPRSIAIMGASTRAGSVGADTLHNLRTGNYPGTIYLINPRYEEIEGTPCYRSLADLPEVPEHVYIGLGNNRLEAAVDELIAIGVNAVTIISTTVLAEDRTPLLRDRIEKKLIDADIMCCGGNGMGFYNFNEGVRLTGFRTRAHEKSGNVALISQSGSGMCGIVDVEERIDFSLAVSTGQELTVTMDQYVDYALEMEGTRVIGLFIETFRNPSAMIEVLKKANAKQIPIVAIKVGRTDFSAKMALSHSGALVGEDTSYDALFDKYGVSRVQELDELVTTLIMFAQPHSVGDGAFVSLHDSGGERQLTIDVADALDVPLADLSQETIAKIEPLLDPGVLAINPLDNWAEGGDDFDDKAAETFGHMLCDHGAAIGAVMQARLADGQLCAAYVDYLVHANEVSGKPVFLVSGRQGTAADPLVVEATRRGMPVLDGILPFLKGVKHLLAYRDFLKRPETSLPSIDAAVVSKWKQCLQGTDVLREADASALLADFGIPCLPYAHANNEAETINSANALGFPVALKTDAPDVTHKSDVDGVMLNLNSDEEVRAAYEDLSSRLGSQVLVTPMIEQTGTELILGATRDPSFGPILTFGFGGVLVEILKDVTFLICPFDPAAARRKLDTLKMRALLDGVRGTPKADIDRFCAIAARFSVMVYELQDQIEEIDINPILVSQSQCVALDALVLTTGNSSTPLKEVTR